MAHTFSRLTTHIVFGTKDRAACIGNDVIEDLHAYLGGIIRNLGGIALNVGGVADHVHLLVRSRPALSIADLVEKAKANSSKWMHHVRGLPFGWQKGYSAFSVSPSDIERISRYVDDQREHHTRVTFAEEYIRFLKEAGVEYDERYIFE